MGLVVAVIPFWTEFGISETFPAYTLTPVASTAVGNAEVVDVSGELIERTLLFASSIKVGRVDGVSPVDSVSVGRALQFASFGDVVGPAGKRTCEGADSNIGGFVEGIVAGLAYVDTLFGDGVCIHESGGTLAVGFAFHGVVVAESTRCAVSCCHTGACSNIAKQSHW